MKILTVGCSYTGGVWEDIYYKPAPASFIGNEHQVWNAGLNGSSNNLSIWLLPDLLQSIEPDHVFFQIIGQRRHTFAFDNHRAIDVLKSAWRSDEHYHYLHEPTMKHHFNWWNMAGFEDPRKRTTEATKVNYEYYKRVVLTAMFKDVNLAYLAYAKFLLKDISHTFVGGNCEENWVENSMIPKMEKVIEENIVLPYKVIPDIENHFVDVGWHLSRAGCQEYANRVYLPYLPTGA
jgi:hypothetical protein